MVCSGTEEVRFQYEDTSLMTRILCLAVTASFICSLIMRKEGLGKEENGCLKYKCSPQAADCNWPQTVSPGSNTVCLK